ncbi:ABC transporter permease [Actinoplanes oblitus]|uniref:ABC transporter permease n=1 Tax=Actinoplanes oblitus TaxID=3040509 RepID=A0ABY8WQ95_9ACTN|nr:ABC transporter permease [Actinoplanes oblitus]WIM97950.1 ABC transporter permease [Actinoplanes oblitus]
MIEENEIQPGRQFRRFALAVCAIGMVIQLALTAYYLGMGHRAAPHHLPVGLVASAEQRAEVIGVLTAGDRFEVADYPAAEALTTAIRRREVYGGADLTGDTPHLYVAGAAGPAAASLLRSTYTSMLQQRTAAQVTRLAQTASRVGIVTVQSLTAPPLVTDVVPLPADDVNGVSLGFLTQALSLGGTVASMGLGRLIPRTRRSWRRGVAHLSTLILYAVGSAVAVLWSMSWFGIGSHADRWEMLGIFSLISLAVTGSTAGAVAVIGPPGAAVGAFYFMIGTVISGASILPEFLPTFGRVLGENLPTGAGVQAVRDNLYFPDAPVGPHLGVLAAYAIVGSLLVLVTNVLPNRKNSTSEIDLDLTVRLEGPPAEEKSRSDSVFRGHAEPVERGNRGSELAHRRHPEPDPGVADSAGDHGDRDPDLGIR